MLINVLSGFVLRMDGKRADAGNLGGQSCAQHGIFRQGLSYPLFLPARIRGKPRQSSGQALGRIVVDHCPTASA